MEKISDKLDFESFCRQVIADYYRALILKKIIDTYQWHSFYRMELLLSVLMKLSKSSDIVYNLPFPYAFHNDITAETIKKEHLFIQDGKMAASKNYLQNISIISGMAVAVKQITGNNETMIFAGLSIAGMTEIDLLKLMENLSECNLPINIFLLDIHKAKGDFLKVRDYFEPKVNHRLKTLVADISDYRSIAKVLTEGVTTTAATGIPVIYYPIEKLINQVDYFNDETEPLKKNRIWILGNNIAQEKEILEIEAAVQQLTI